MRPALLRHYYYSSSRGGYSEEYQAVLTYATAQGFTLPTTQQRQKENAKLLAMKTSGVWDEADIIYNFRTNGDLDFACINWKSPGTYQPTKSASIPYFIRKEGVQGDGVAAMYLNTGWIPATHGVNYTLADSGIAVGILTNVDDSGDLEFGASDNSNADRTFLLGRMGANTAYCMSAATSRSIANGSNSIGRYLVKRIGGTISLFKDGSSLDSGAVAATGLPNVAMGILAENGNGSFRNYSARRVSHFMAGSSHDGLESALDTVESDFVTAIAEDDPDETKILFEGDSITFGTGTTKGLSYPVRTFVNLDRAMKYNNIGVAGWTSTQMLARVADYGDYIDSNGVFVLFTGTNDILNSVATATTWQNIQDIITAVKALGVTKITVGTLMDCSSYDAAQDTLRANLNTLIVNNAASIGYAVMDFSGDASLGTHSATYYDDTVHPNNAGAAIMATIAETAIETVL